MQCYISYLPMTKSLPSTRPAETNSWETPSAESEHRQRNKKPNSYTWVQSLLEHDKSWKKLVDTPSPLPDMNSNRMSLSSFLGFLSLRTRLMGTLVLAAAGSCNIKITASHTRVFRKVNLRLHCVLSCFWAPITLWSVCTWETKSSCLLDLKKYEKYVLDWQNSH